LTDLQEDLRLRAKTVPVEFGLGDSIRFILASLALAVAMSIVLFWMTPYGLGPQYLAGSLLAGLFLLLLPAYRLYKGESPGKAIALFNRASNYPLVMLLVVMISW
jgi:4-hydroxybenzoate polyprenyltransferase